MTCYAALEARRPGSRANAGSQVRAEQLRRPRRRPCSRMVLTRCLRVANSEHGRFRRDWPRRPRCRASRRGHRDRRPGPTGTRSSAHQELRARSPTRQGATETLTRVMQTCSPRPSSTGRRRSPAVAPMRGCSRKVGEHLLEAARGPPHLARAGSDAGPARGGARRSSGEAGRSSSGWSLRRCVVEANASRRARDPRKVTPDAAERSCERLRRSARDREHRDLAPQPRVLVCRCSPTIGAKRPSHYASKTRSSKRSATQITPGHVIRGSPSWATETRRGTSRPRNRRRASGGADALDEQTFRGAGMALRRLGRGRTAGRAGSAADRSLETARACMKGRETVVAADRRGPLFARCNLEVEKQAYRGSHFSQGGRDAHGQTSDAASYDIFEGLLPARVGGR